MKLTYFGHSAFQIEVGGAVLLLDPFISGNKHAEGIVSAEDLSPDFILLTHAHGDHWGDTPSIAVRSGAQVIANFEITSYLTSHHGHENVQPLNTGGSWTYDWGRVTQTYARHSSAFPDGTYGGNPNGFMIEGDGKMRYAMGDTCPFSEMSWLAEDYAIDVALMPIGDCFTMGPTASIRAANLVNAPLTVPVHYNTFPLIEVDTSEWERLMEDAGHRTKVMKPGEEMGI